MRHGRNYFEEHSDVDLMKSPNRKALGIVVMETQNHSVQMIAGLKQKRVTCYIMCRFTLKRLFSSSTCLCTAVFALTDTYLDDRAFLGMKAKSSKGKNSLGPIMPNPFVRFIWSLGKEECQEHIYCKESFNTTQCCERIFTVAPAPFPKVKHFGKKEAVLTFNSNKDLQKKFLQIRDGIRWQGLDSQHRKHDPQPHWKTTNSMSPKRTLLPKLEYLSSSNKRGLFCSASNGYSTPKVKSARTIKQCEEPLYSGKHIQVCSRNNQRENGEYAASF